MKKLFVVKVAFEYAVLAKDEDDAKFFIDEAFAYRQDGEAMIEEVEEATPSTPLPRGWKAEDLVHGTHDGVTWEQAVQLVKPRAPTDEPPGE